MRSRLGSLEVLNRQLADCECCGTYSMWAYYLDTGVQIVECIEYEIGDEVEVDNDDDL